MNITPPILDDSSFDDLRSKLVNRIPVYNPEWTDHNASDPGITLLELFAYLGEHIVHRFNQIPETTYIEYLNLLQIPRRSAEPAHAFVSCSSDSLPVKPINASATLSAGKIKFETSTVVDVWPISSIAMIKAAAEFPIDNSAAASQIKFAMDALDSPEGAEAVAYELSQVANTQDSNSLDAATAVDGMVWIAILNNTKEPNKDILDAMTESAATINVGFMPDELAPDSIDIDPCPGPNSQAINPAVQWQVSTLQKIDSESPQYRRLDLAGDTTGGLKQTGILRFKVPKQAGSFIYMDDDVRGAGDFPPQLDEENEAKLLFWIRGFHVNQEDFGLLKFMDVNVCDCKQLVSANPAYLGIGNAQPNQQVYLKHIPVVANTLELEVEEAGVWRSWQEVEGFHASRDDDPHYLLDRVTGTISFGAKKVPQIGQRIRASKYKYGGGIIGNVAAESIDSITNISGVKVNNPLPAYGGTDDEDLATSLNRIPSEIRRRDRAVTPGDFRELAVLTPSANIVRAETIELFRPKTRETNAAGVVSVMVWPDQVCKPDEKPMPTRTQLRQVCTWLDARRLVTTEVYVIPPVYRSVAVAVGLKTKAGFSVDAVRVWVEAVLRQYLSAIPPFGPYGEGWPLGRDVHSAELEAAALQVEGVEYLEGLELSGFDQATQTWVKGRVNLEIDEVPWLEEITVVEGTPLEPGEAIGIPETPGPLIPVPIIVDEC